MNGSTFLFGLLSSVASMTGTMESEPLSPLPWHFNAGIGYVSYQGVLDSSTGLQRLAIARDVAQYEGVALGFEVGVQTGLDARLSLDSNQQDLLGGPAVQVNIRPFADFLVTAMRDICPIPNVAGFVKAGVAYRQMNFDRATLGSKTQISPEFQAGFSLFLSDKARVALGYQGIYTNTIKLRLNGVVPDATGYANSIPSQNGALLTFTMNA